MAYKRVAEDSYLWEPYPYYSLREVIVLHYDKEIHQRLFYIAEHIEEFSDKFCLFPGFIFAAVLSKFPGIETMNNDEYQDILHEVYEYIKFICKSINANSDIPANDLAHFFVGDNVDKFKHILIDKCIMLPMYSEDIANVAFEYFTNYKLNKNKKTDFTDGEQFVVSCIEKAFSIKYDSDCRGFICYNNIEKNEEEDGPVVGMIAEYKNDQEEKCVGVIVSTGNIVHPSLSPSLTLNVITVEDGHIIYKQVPTIICNVLRVKQSYEVIDTKQRAFFKESENFKYEIPWASNFDSLFLLNKTNIIRTSVARDNDLEISIVPGGDCQSLGQEPNS